MKRSEGGPEISDAPVTIAKAYLVFKMCTLQRMHTHGNYTWIRFQSFSNGIPSACHYEGIDIN